MPTFYLTLYRTYILTFYPTYILTFYPTYILTFYLTYVLAFYPTFNQAFYPTFVVFGILSRILFDTHSGILFGSLFWHVNSIIWQRVWVRLGLLSWRARCSVGIPAFGVCARSGVRRDVVLKSRDPRLAKQANGEGILKTRSTLTNTSLRIPSRQVVTKLQHKANTQKVCLNYVIALCVNDILVPSLEVCFNELVTMWIEDGAKPWQMCRDMS